MTRPTIRPVPIEQTRGLRQSVLRPNQTVEAMAEHEPAGAFAIGAFDGDELIAVGVIGSDDAQAGVWRIRGMATVPHARGLGVGTAVLEALIEHASSSGAERIWCNARTPALSLYERAGFRAASEEFEVEDIGPHFVMERRLRRR